MILINTIGSDYFSLNGTTYAKIYQPLKQGDNNVGIYNVNDTKLQLINSTNYTEFKINGINYNSQDDVIDALLPVIYKMGGNNVEQFRNIIASTTPPSGIPADGDEWVIYEI
ncbi:hypothetical protein BA195_10165 [Tenacibaculum soleae]|uniref:Uncharacterized protein n=1 Tax=Tenacibaculum soleae TaxID=447689 RepID=A0A1B9XYL6_9FLAO|nr:hypothetical protein [Tenacibaculum soleae]OCK42531.1 hypothetical protein BA195_10165 [Tenacibaculum soleae]